MYELPKRFLRKVLAIWGFKLVRVSGPRPGLRSLLLREAQSDIFTDYEFRELVDQMDRGDFDFDEATQSKMIQQWHRNNSLMSTPYPTIMVQAYNSGDALALNSFETMEITYHLPYARAYEQAQEGKYLSLVKLASTNGVQFDDQVVVDVGCGLGGLLNVVSSCYKPSKLYGIDCASSAIKWMSKNRSHIIGIVADIESPNETFRSVCNFKADLVFCIHVLEHLRYPHRALENLLSLKKRGGVVIAAVPNGRLDTATQHINFWSPESWRFFVERIASNYTVIINRCPNPSIPGGYDNMAIIR